MNKVKLSVSAPKEVVDALVALDDLVSKVVAGEPVTQIALEEFQAAVKLVPELSAIPPDAQGEPDETADAVGLYGHRIANRLLKRKVEPVVVS